MVLVDGMMLPMLQSAFEKESTQQSFRMDTIAFNNRLGGRGLSDGGMVSFQGVYTYPLTLFWAFDHCGCPKTVKRRSKLRPSPKSYCDKTTRFARNKRYQ